MHGAHAIHEEITRRNLNISVAGIPKTRLSDRWTGRDETNNIWGLLLYSAGEDFYNIYQEDKDIEAKKIANIDLN